MKFELLVLLFFILTVVLLPLIKSDQITDKLESWVTISSAALVSGGEKGSTELHLTTDNTEIGNIDLVLTQRGNLHSARLKSSVTKCLYQGYISKGKQAKTDSPVRIKFCSKDGQNIPELSGLIFLNGKVFTLYTNNENGTWIMFTSEHFRKDLKNDKVCGAKQLNSNKKFRSKIDPVNAVSLDPAKKMKSSEKQLTSRYRRNTPERSYVEIILFHSFDYYEVFGPSEQDVSHNFFFVFENIFALNCGISC